MPTPRVKSKEHSGKLSNRQRVFCELAATGMTQVEAYIQAGFHPQSRDKAAIDVANLKKRPHVLAYLNECRRKAAASADLTAQRIMEELRAVACSDIEDYTLGAGGELIVREDAHPLASRAVASKKWTVKRRISTGAEGETQLGVETTEGEIKLWNKVEALKLSAEIVGLTDRDQQSVGVRIDQIVINLPSDTPAPRVLKDAIGELVESSTGGNG